jgi:hypothetical protein
VIDAQPLTVYALLVVGLYLGFWSGVIVACMLIGRQQEPPPFRMLNRDEVLRAMPMPSEMISRDIAARARRLDRQRFSGRPELPGGAGR